MINRFLLYFNGIFFYLNCEEIYKELKKYYVYNGKVDIFVIVIRNDIKKFFIIILLSIVLEVLISVLRLKVMMMMIDDNNNNNKV